MKARVTALAAVFVLVGLASTSTAQPVRNNVDVIWARDVAGATMTLDGVLDEAVWQQAETIELVWNGDHALPGSGQRTEGNYTLAEPSDPNDGTIFLLRDGNTIWLGAEVRDKSVGGKINLQGTWGFDGLIMNILDRTRLINERVHADGFLHPRYFQGNRTEFFISWWNNTDTTDATTTYANGELIGGSQPLPGIPPRLAGFYGGPSAIEPRSDENVAVWDARTVVDGIANDDTHGEDVGYTIEMRLDVTALGYDFTQDGGDKMAWNIALNDRDFAWPVNSEIDYLSRVWWQNQWGNNFNEGAGYLYGAPGVTVNSAAPEVTEPEFTIPSGELFPHPEIDGRLDEDVWERVDPSFIVQYQPDVDLIQQNPEIARYYMFFWRPGVVPPDPAAPIVVDPSVARYKMFFKDNILYVGLDVEDQAISGSAIEDGMDGTYLFIRDRDSTKTNGVLFARRFDFRVDSTGGIGYGAEALRLNEEDPTAVRAAVHLKGASTVGDPSDVDEGYQIEIAIDLTKALNYPDGLGDGMLWTSMNFLDGDFLPSASDSYTMRTWIDTERGNGGDGASIYGFLDAGAVIGVSTETAGEIPAKIELLGNYPNPFNPSTTLSYAIPHSGKVSVQIFDALGRGVATLEAGAQAAGSHKLSFKADQLASGVYFYRVNLKGAEGSEFVSSVGQLILVK